MPGMLRMTVGVLISLCMHWAQADNLSLRVALFDVVPYATLAGGKPQGLYVDWMRDFLGGLGIQADISVLPFARIPLAIEHDEADLTISFATEALVQIAMPVGPVLRVDSVLVTSTARPAARLSQLQGASIGRARGGCQDLAQRADLGLKWVEVSGFDKGLRMLELGRLDGLCLTRDVLRHYLPALGIARAHLGPEIVVGHRVASLFARKALDPALVARLQAALSRRAPMQRD